MAKYKTQENGVVDTENNRYIPASEGNRHWREFLEWVNQGNEPDPQFTVDDAAQRDRSKERAQILQELRSHDTAIFKLLVAMFKVGHAKGIWNKADFEAEEPGLVDTFNALRIRITRLEELKD